MENKLTEQEVQQILDDVEQQIEQAAASIKQRALDELGLILRHGRKPLVSESEIEALLDYTVETMTGLDGMITRDFMNYFNFLCKENGIENTMNDTTIPLRVQKHGYTIINKKHPLLKKKVRVFKRV